MNPDHVIRLVFPPMPATVAVLIYPMTLSIALCVGTVWALIILTLLCVRGGWWFGGWVFDRWEESHA
jgi:hypothetical protein